MEQISTALIEARLENMRKDHPQAESQQIWMMVFLQLQNLNEVKAYLDFGFNPESPSSSQLINQKMQSQFGSQLYGLFAEYGRNPHVLRQSNTLLYSLYDVLSYEDPNSRFSLSDVGMAIHQNTPIAWSKLRDKGLMTWDLPCGKYKNLEIHPAELALVEGNISLAHRILEDGGIIHNTEIFPSMVQKFLNNKNTNPVVKSRVWDKMLSFNSALCASGLEKFASQQKWSNETLEKFKSELSTQFMQKKEKNARPLAIEKNSFTDNQRNSWVKDLLNGHTWSVFKAVLNSMDPQYLDIAECIYKEEKGSLDLLDSNNPLTSIVKHVVSNHNQFGVRFLLNKGLRGDQIIDHEKGDTILHTWLSGRLHSPPKKEYLKTFSLLLKATDNVCVVNNKGNTALFTLVAYNYDGTTVSPLIEAMMKSGLNVRIRNQKNQTASEFLFAERGSPMVAEFLRNLEMMQDKNALLEAVEGVDQQVNKRRM